MREADRVTGTTRQQPTEDLVTQPACPAPLPLNGSTSQPGESHAAELSNAPAQKAPALYRHAAELGKATAARFPTIAPST